MVCSILQLSQDVSGCLRKSGNCEDNQSTRAPEHASSQEGEPDHAGNFRLHRRILVPIAFAEVALSIRIHRSDSFRALRVHGSSMLKPCQNMIQPSKSSKSSTFYTSKLHKTTRSLLDPSHPLRIISAQDTGDVLLFKSQGTFPQLIRAASRAAAMNGRYDHVGSVPSGAGLFSPGSDQRNF